MPKRILISGCSYTNNAIWPSLLWPQHHVINLGRPGAGNRYISESIIKSIDRADPPDAVFALFSGVNRSDVLVPKNAATQLVAREYKWHGEIKNSLYFFSGGDQYNDLIANNYNRIRDDSWPTVSNFDDFLDLPPELIQESINSGIVTFSQFNRTQLVHHAMMINYLSNQSFLIDNTYFAIVNLQTWLERLKIPYMFSFIYDPFDTDYRKLFGTLDATNSWHKHVAWDKFVDIHPLEIGLEYDLLQHDGIHITPEGQAKWVELIQTKVNKGLTNGKKHFFKNLFVRA